MWNESDVGKQTLLNRVFNMEQVDFANKTVDDDLQTKNIKRAIKLYKQHRIGDAVKMLNSFGTVKWTPANLEKIRRKHPQAAPPELSDEPSPPAYQASEETVLKNINSFATGTGCGRDGNRAQFFKDALRGALPTDREFLIKVITEFVNHMLKANFPASLMKYYTSAPIVPLAKDDTPEPDLRPITIGEFFRRLTGKVSAQYANPILAEEIAPLQIGSGIKSGCQAIAHTVRELADLFDNDPTAVLLKVDGYNAFQEFDRGAMARAYRKYLPGLYRLIVSWYCHEAPILFCGDTIIRSEKGSSQGCPLGGISFSITIHAILLEIQQQCPNLNLHTWFFDDSNIYGKIPDVLRAYEIIKEKGPQLGFFPTDIKSILWSPTISTAASLEALEVFPAEIKRETNGGTDIMKSPIGTKQYCEAHMQNKVKKWIKTLEVIREGLLDHPLMALQMLQYCLGAAKAGYFLSATPIAMIRDAIAHYDNEIHTTIEEVFNVSLSGNERKELALPQSLGGLNLRISSDLADAAYIGSLVQTQNLRNKLLNHSTDTISTTLTESLDRFNLTHSKDVSQQLIIASSKPQKHLSAIINFDIKSMLFESADTTAKARPFFIS